MASKWPLLALAVFVTSLVTDVRTDWEEDVIGRLESLEMASTALLRQNILQQFAQEEATRSDGDSGLKQVRASVDGTKAYYTATHATHAAAAIHDHTDNIRTCGMGEFEAVLNGNQFRTRHNDYGLYMPHRNSSVYHKTEPIPLPEVPPAVLNAGDVVAQIREMRAWFRAWQEQDHSQRDYRPYFKPVLCYLEGAWTNNEKLDEPFESTRHHLDAASWFDLQEKVRFTAYTGDKDQAENFAFLPTAIFNITESGIPVLAQWNYRILCHPIEDQLLDVQHLRPVDDLSSRLRLGKTMDDFLKTRAARFFITEHTTDRIDYNGNTLLDRLMAQIPGKDNYAGNIDDTLLGRTKYNHLDENEILNSARYHRWYKIGMADAMGVSINHRGLADRNLFVAQTTQEKVVPMEAEVCESKDNCQTYRARVSYAVPLEVVWLTPLNSWNPYDIEYKGGRRDPLYSYVTADGRNGGFTQDTALNGTNEVNYMVTPVEFYDGTEMGGSPADTSRFGVGVLDRNGTVRTVASSGIRIFLPTIVDVPGGNIRTRYPVFPVFAEGNTAFKEIEALQKIVMDLTANAHLLHNQPQFGSGTSAPSTDSGFFSMVTSSSDASAGVHVHIVNILSQLAEDLMDGTRQFVVARTDLANEHSHLLNITFNDVNQTFFYVHCDGRDEGVRCWDNHPPNLFQTSG